MFVLVVCTAECTLKDGDYATSSRWSCGPNLGSDGESCTISYDLGQVYNLAQIRLGKRGPSSRKTPSPLLASCGFLGSRVTYWNHWKRGHIKRYIYCFTLFANYDPG